QVIHIATVEARERNRPLPAPHRAEMGVALKHLFEQGRICVENGPGSARDFFEVLESYDADQLGQMGGDNSIQVIQSPHSVCKLWRRQDPPAAQSAQPIYLGQTAGDDEMLSQMK